MKFKLHLHIVIVMVGTEIGKGIGIGIGILSRVCGELSYAYEGVIKIQLDVAQIVIIRLN